MDLSTNEHSKTSIRDFRSPAVMPDQAPEAANTASPNQVLPGYENLPNNSSVENIWQGARSMNDTIAHPAIPSLLDKSKKFNAGFPGRRHTGPTRIQPSETPWSAITNVDTMDECNFWGKSSHEHFDLIASSTPLDGDVFIDYSPGVSSSQQPAALTERNSHSSRYYPIWLQTATQNSHQQTSLSQYPLHADPTLGYETAVPQQSSPLPSPSQLLTASLRLERQKQYLQKQAADFKNGLKSRGRFASVADSATKKPECGLSVETFTLRAKRMGFDPGASLDVAETFLAHKWSIEGKERDLEEAIGNWLSTRSFSNPCSANQVSDFKRNLFSESVKEFKTSFTNVHIPNCSGHLEQQALYLSLGLYHSSLCWSKTRPDLEELMANCQLEAMAWQLEILNTWIDGLCEQDAEQDRIDSYCHPLLVTPSGDPTSWNAAIKEVVSPRRPGRPPGSKNRQGIARRQHPRRRRATG